MTDSSAPDITAFVAGLAPLTERINATLPTLLPDLDAATHPLHEACEYSLMAGGKRLRPLLVALTAEAAGGDAEAAVPVACAWEYIHTYSLVHDDLPAMDNDTLRRGQPTTWKQYGESTAILAGDALLTEAFAIVAAHAPDATTARDLTAEIARAAGMRGMVGGQAADLAGEGLPPSEPMLAFIHRHKTGALLQSCVRAGARLAGASGDVLACLDAYAESLGLAFQIVDDILDMTQSADHLGKSAGKDADQHKLTYPAVHGLDRSREIARELIDSALTAITPLGSAADRLRDMAHWVLHRTN